MSQMGPRIGLLGGSFNPAHGGHLHISRQALELLDLDEVWWLVSPQNPLKSETEMASLKDRVKAAQNIAKAEPRIRVTAVEAELGTRYSVDTIAALQARHPDLNFVWMIGADNLRQMARWKGWRRLFRSVPIAVFPRAPYSLRAMNSRAARVFASARVAESKASDLASMMPPAWMLVKAPRHGASATNIRRGLRPNGDKT